MKKLFPVIALLVVMISCSKDEDQQPVKDYFNEPVLDWTLDKQGVIEREKRTLLGDHGPEDIVWISPEYESKGSGYLEFSADMEAMIKVSYGFYCNAETLVIASCTFVNNSHIANELTDFMVNKYGKIYTEVTEGSVTKLIWEQQGYMVTLYTGSYSLFVQYKKNLN